MAYWGKSESEGVVSSVMLASVVGGSFLYRILSLSFSQTVTR